MSENLDLQRENDYLKDTIACMQGEIAALKSGTQSTTTNKAITKLPCDTCGVEIEQRDYQYNNSKNHFCSRECKKNYIVLIDVECETCGRLLQRHPFRLERTEHHLV